MAANGIQYAGEFTISDAKIFSSSGNIVPLEGLVQSITIFDNMYRPSMTGMITILDTNSLVKNLPIIGQEFLSFKIKTSSITGTLKEDIIDFTDNVFNIYKVDNRIINGKVEVLALHFASGEKLLNSRVRVSKSYTNSINDIVQDVLQNESYLNTKKDLFIEGTVGVRKIVAPSDHPFALINKLATEAISLEHGSPYFMFYENKDGFHFRSLDSLYSQPTVSKYNTGDFFHQTDRGGTVVHNVIEEYGRPIDQQIVSSNDMLDSVDQGLLGSTFISYNIYSKSYFVSRYNYFDNFRDFNRISDNPIYNSNEIDEFRNTVADFPNSKRHLHPTSKDNEKDAQYYSIDNSSSSGRNIKSLYSPNRVENSLLARQSKFVELQRGVIMNLKVYGTSNVAVGQTVEVDFNVAGESHGGDLDPYYTGKYLITQLSHNFSFAPKKEHTIAMTVSKDGYEQELEQNTAAREPRKRSRGVVSKNVI